jgi:hypothetical protein
MYCMYNNLAFVNLNNYDPTTYFLLLQLRVVVTGVVFQVGLIFMMFLFVCLSVCLCVSCNEILLSECTFSR